MKLNAVFVSLLLVGAVACASKNDPAPAGTGGARGAANTGGSVGTASGGATGSADAGADAAPDPTAVIGAFDIRLVSADPGTATSPPVAAFVAVQGKVGSVPRPPLLTLEVTAREGECVVEIPSPPHCEPACLEGTCVKGGRCVAEPQPRSVGQVKLTGLATAGGAALTMAPEPPQFFYQPAAELKITVPPFAEGAPLGLEAAGGDLPAFAITSKGTVELEVTSTTPVPMERGKPMALRWKAATLPDNSRVAIAVDISHHGGFKGQITCDVADDGSFDVPAALVGKLIDLGVAGYPTTTVTRRTRAAATLAAGRVELNVLSERILPIMIPGYVSCSEDDPCPSGKTCSQAGLCQ
jgi:hypothetical protein